jgi:hypothetical protein
MRPRMLKTALLLSLLVGCANSVACTCREVSLEQMYSQAEYVVVGRVTSAAEREWILRVPAQGGEVKVPVQGVEVKFKVEEKLKGWFAVPSQVMSGYGSWDCSVEFIVGRSYVFFVPESGRVSYCSGTQELSRHNPRDEELLKKLNDLKSRGKSAP